MVIRRTAFTVHRPLLRLIEPTILLIEERAAPPMLSNIHQSSPSSKGD
jgi:hypothetical protein